MATVLCRIKMCLAILNRCICHSLKHTHTSSSLGLRIGCVLSVVVVFLDKIDRVGSRVTILVDLKVVGRQSKRTQEHVP